jgi:hypothetical protein
MKTPKTSQPAQAFQTRRFALLARAQWAEQSRSWGGFLLAFSLIYALCLLLALGTASKYMLTQEMQAGYYTAGLLVSGYLFAGRYFAGIDKREGNLLLLMQPASALEKMLLAALVILLLYPLAYTAAFELLTWPARLLALNLAQAVYAKNAQAGLMQQPPFTPERYADFWPFVQNARAHSLFALVYIATTGFSLAGSLYFRGSALLKGFALAAALFLLTSIWMVLIAPYPAALSVWWNPGAHFGIRAQFLSACVWLGIPVLLWLSAYWNLRERVLS